MADTANVQEVETVPTLEGRADEPRMVEAAPEGPNGSETEWGCVYVIAAAERTGDGQCIRGKIGSTRDLKARLKDLRSGSPLRLLVVAVFPTFVKDLLRVERVYQQMFAPLRMHGEWFDFRWHDLLWFMAEERMIPRGEEWPHHPDVDPRLLVPDDLRMVWRASA